MGKKKADMPRRESPEEKDWHVSLAEAEKLIGNNGEQKVMVSEETKPKENVARSDIDYYPNNQQKRNNNSEISGEQRNNAKNHNEKSWNGNYRSSYGSNQGKGSNYNAQNSQKHYGKKTQGYGKKNMVHELPLNEGPHAPYNFVRFQDRVMETQYISGHNQIGVDGLYTGYLHYEMTAQTPIMVEGKQGEFYRNKDNKFAIPGSTMRGLIRNNLQILSFSGFKDDIDDYNLMYRAVADGCLNERYTTILGEVQHKVNGHRITVPENVRAGYIERRGTDYYLYREVGNPNTIHEEGETNYYVVSEKYILDNDQDNFACLLNKFQNRGPGGTYRNLGNKKYGPYCDEITYELSNNKISRIQSKGLSHKGYVISTGKISKKKVFFVIPERDGDAELIPKDSIMTYQIDLKSRENTIKIDDRGFYGLPEDGQIRPIFYIDYGGRLYFGYTPRLRLMYDHTIHDGIHQEEVSCDYVKAMFGYSNGENSLKSRVYFTDALLMNKKYPQKEVQLVLGEPKPTSYLEYLEQKDGEPVKTYNDDFRLRGVKQYWLQENVTMEAKSSGKDKVLSNFKPLEAQSRFAGDVQFENLTKEELGLLIWSIRLEKDSQMNVGKAKAYGYGRVKFDEIKLFLQNPEKAYVADSAVFGVNVYEEKTEQQRDAFVDKYLCALAKWLGVSGKEAVYKNPSIKDFFEMKSYLAKGRTAAYMSLQNPSGRGNGRDQTQDGYAEYKQNNNPLPTVSNITSSNK